MKEDSVTPLDKEKQLAAALAALPKEASPSRDLWPEIEAELTAPVTPVTKAYKSRWIPIAMAASLLISFAALWMSWSYFEDAKQLYATNHQLKADSKERNIQAQIKSMEHEYSLAKSALLAQIGMNSAHTERNLLADVKSNLIIIEQATQALKSAIMQQPEDPALIKLLNATYQQELVVLTKLAKLNQGS
ncbi:hypothetical protein [Aliikangiella sp. IMCC44359]|uniref:hypothetical protein n=1 Tax=Aliikangiella sp. IMCC44359 TaxID=3459125 RepID=UPI00403B0844